MPCGLDALFARAHTFGVSFTMLKFNAHVFLVAILFVLVSCEGKQSSIDLGDSKLADLTHRALDADGIPHQIDNTAIIFNSEDEDSVEKASLRVRKGHTKLKFEDREVREHFYSLLEQKGIEYQRAQPADNGQVVFWSDNDEVVTELLSKSLYFRAQKESEQK